MSIQAYTYACTRKSRYMSADKLIAVRFSTIFNAGKFDRLGTGADTIDMPQYAGVFVIYAR